MRIALAACLFALAACKKEEVQVYSLARPTRPVPAPPAAPGAAPTAAALPDGHPPIGAGMGALPPELVAPATEGPAALAWKAPAGWTEKAAAGMRRATFAVPGGAGAADLSIISLPGDAGGELANVNRWRAQVGLGPWDEAAFKKAAETVASPAGRFIVVDLAGPAQRMLAAMTTRGGETWFFKLVGPDQTVGAARPAFKTFLAGVRAAG
ncbi:MAG: hypothetical protein HYZ75_03385 [Elusimicrobia bacterium]|nr:hypothetical protein [Elusimicrobiota bacterium]